MKKKTKEFEKDMRDILTKILNKGSLSDYFEKNPEPLCECIDRQYISGIRYGRSIDGKPHFDLQKSMYIRYKGIEFLENKHPNLKSNVQLAISVLSGIISIFALVVSVLSNLGRISTALKYLWELLSFGQ